MKITYHRWKDFSECPKKYYLGHIKKEPPHVPINEYHTLYGKLVEMFFEMFCNIWRYETPYMPPDYIRKKLDILYEGILQTSTVKWSGFGIKYSREEILEQAFQDVCKIMDSPNQNYFLNTRSEVTIEVQLKNEHKLEGRLDFIHKHHLSNDIYIFDGKGTNKIGKNVSNNQLLFYALLYFFHYKVLPVELGFFYFRLNSYIPIFFTQEILNEFRSKIAVDMKSMLSTSDLDYQPTPSAKSCKYCVYNVDCLECILSKGKRAKKSKIEDIQGEGIVEFGL
jgi:hypothetical protein